MATSTSEVELGVRGGKDETKVADGLEAGQVTVEKVNDAENKDADGKGLGWVLAGLILFSFTAPSALVGVPCK